jgi:hypothetical protein
VNPCLNPICGPVQEQFVEEDKPKLDTVETYLNEPSSIEKKPAPCTTHYMCLSTFSWDEEPEKVKVLILSQYLFVSSLEV